MISQNEDLGGGQGITVPIPEDHRQAILLALANLSLERPGWEAFFRGIAETLDGGNMFAGFRETSSLPAGIPKDTGNDFGVVRMGNEIKVLHLNRVAGENAFTLSGAVVLAAWLAVLADPELKEFHRLAKEITK